MDKDNAKQLMDEMIKSAAAAIECAKILAEKAAIPLDLSPLNIGEDMWYVSADEYRQELMDDFLCGRESGKITQEELQEVEERMKEILENGGYDDSGYKVLGWMSSSTNC